MGKTIDVNLTSGTTLPEGYEVTEKTWKISDLEQEYHEFLAQMDAEGISTSLALFTLFKALEEVGIEDDPDVLQAARLSAAMTAFMQNADDERSNVTP